MVKKESPKDRRKRRMHDRLRNKGLPRCCVSRSLRHIHGQIIDDQKGQTIVAASSLEKPFCDEKETGVTLAKKVGQVLGERCIKAGVQSLCFDRGPFLYHGRVRAFADGVREKGVKF